MHQACLPGGRYLVVPLLSSLTIDLLLKADGTPLKRDLHSLFASIASAETVEKNSALADFLRGLEPVVLTRIDTATGTVKLNLGDGQRSFSGTVTVGEVEHRVKLELPERIEGGYWRTPGVLQLAFWKGQRAILSTASVSGAEVMVEIECLAVSADGIRLVPAGSAIPEILVGYDSCE